MTTVAVYTRISVGREGEQTATSRQLDLCRGFADNRGWLVGPTFEDVDLSASKRVVRPGFRALTAAIKAGEIDGVLVWKLDRLVRRNAEFERIWELCEAKGVFLTSVTEPLDSSTDLGLALIRILVTIAGLESATISLRVRAFNRHCAAQGIPSRGRRGYGLNQRRTECVGEEAALIREAAARVIAGETADGIVRDWNRRGVPSPTGGKWWDSTLKTILRSPRVAGHRDYRGEIARRDCLPAVLDSITSARVAAILADRHRRESPVTSQQLLGGLVRCGRCGFPLTWSRSPRNAYLCGSTTGCRGVGVSARPLEECALRQTLSRARAGGRGRSPMVEADAVAILQGVAQALDAIPATTEPARRLVVESHRSELLDLMAKTEPLDQRAFYGRGLARRWPGLDMEDRRAQLRRYIRRVTVDVAPPKCGAFDERRVNIDWW